MPCCEQALQHLYASLISILLPLKRESGAAGAAVGGLRDPPFVIASTVPPTPQDQRHLAAYDQG